ncbi:MAG: DUF5362 family protein [Leadbetterella sp.]
MDMLGNMEVNLLNSESLNQLRQTAKWAKIVAIFQIVMAALIILLSFFIGTIFGTLTALSGQPNPFIGGMGIFIGIFYALLGVILMIPSVFQLNFANKIKNGLNSEDPELMQVGFHNLKRYYKFMGILVIISAVFYGLLIVIGLIGGIGSMML